MLAPRKSHYRLYLLITLCAIWSGVGLLHRGIASGPFAFNLQDVSNKVLSTSTSSNTRKAFVQSMIEEPFLSPIDLTGLSNYCADKEWKNDIIIECQHPEGGIGNVRQMMFLCIRWSASVGASMILPQPLPRVAANSSNGDTIQHAYEAPTTFDYFFDKDYFLAAMHKACPKMTIYQDREDIPMEYEEVGLYKPKAYETPRGIANRFGKWLAEHKPESGKASLVSFRRMFKAFKVCEDKNAMTNAIGQLLKPQDEVLRLAAIIIDELTQRYGLSNKVEDTFGGDGYVGVHLRTAKDAMQYKFLSYEIQAKTYKKYIDEYKPPVVYVASGNLSSVALFASVIAPVPVVDKMSLLSPEDSLRLKALTWDSQGQVDFIVLQRAAHFLGMGHSSYSISLGASRRLVNAKEGCGPQNVETRMDGEEDEASFDDGYSVIIGKSKYPDMVVENFWP